MTVSMLNQSNTNSSAKKSVRFHTTEVSVVHSIERIEDSQIEELFYQPEEVFEFRQAFNVFRAQQNQAKSKGRNQPSSVNMARVNALVEQARMEIQKAQLSQGSSSNSNSMNSSSANTSKFSTSAPSVHVSFVTRPTQRRNPQMSSQKGRAQMA